MRCIQQNGLCLDMSNCDFIIILGFGKQLTISYFVRLYGFYSEMIIIIAVAM